MPQARGNSINPSANRGRNTQALGAAVNFTVGAALIAKGTALMKSPPTMPLGATLLGMGILAVAQGVHTLDASNASGRTFNASQIGGASGTNGTVRDEGSGRSAFGDPRIQEAMQTLAANGYSFSEKGMVNPDGSLTPISAYNSPQAMSEAGLDPISIEEIQKILGSINDELSKPKVAAVPVTSAGAPASPAADKPQASDAGGGLYGSGNPFELDEGEAQGLVAGKTVNFFGEPIGVARSNIFEIMHMAYQRRRGLKQFIETESIRSHTEPSLRAPASAMGPTDN